MDFRLLGPLEVAEHHRSVALGGIKQRSVLAVLLLHANDVVSTERLVDELWGESPPARFTKSIQVYVSRLRKQLGDDRLLTRAPGYVLRVEPSELDVARFERLVAEAETAEPGVAADMLVKALALWRGPPLADLAYERCARAEIARLEELRMAALEQRIEADLALGRHARLIGELRGLVDEHPLRERLRAQLMLALYRCGRQADALDAYRDARRVLLDELGIEPGRALRDLERAILRQDAALDRAARAGPAAARRRGPFVGREPELDQFVAGLDDAFAGRGRLFLIDGEPGIGKSRLAEEVLSRARGRGARVLVGRCWEAGGAPAYWPWVEALRGDIRHADPGALRARIGAGAAELAQILPELRERVPDLPAPAPLDSDSARFRLFDAVGELLRCASREAPIALLIDDLHAADEPSLLLLRFIARELSSTRMLVVCAYRDVDPVPGRALADAVAELTREPVTRRLALAGLSRDEVARYVEQAAGDVASRALVAALHRETDGNPLFVAEIVRLLRIEGVPAPGAGETEFAIPQSVRDVIARRLAHLSDECNRILSLASVLGREFALGALARLSAVPEDRLIDLLDEAVAARVVVDVPGALDRARFAHLLIRDTLYTGLSGVRRARLHRLAVEALEELYGDDPGPHLAELAHHAIAAGEHGKALRYAEQAATRSLALLAYEEAARLYRMALQALGQRGVDDQHARCELLLGLGEAQIRAGETARAKAAFLEAADVARRIGLPRELARAAAGYGGRYVWARAGDDARLVPLLEEALDGLGDDPDLRARLLARLTGALRDEHARDRRTRLSSDAVALAARGPSEATLAYALDARLAAIAAPDTVHECLALADQLREMAERNSDTERVVAADFHRLIARVTLGAIDGARADLVAMIRGAADLRQPAQLWQAEALQAMFAIATGQLAEANAFAERAWILGRRALERVARPVYVMQRYAIAGFGGDPEPFEALMRELVADYPARPVFRSAVVHVLASAGRACDARRAFDEFAADDFSALPLDLEWLYGMCFLAESCGVLGDSRAAAVLHGKLLPYATYLAADPPEGFHGAVSRYLGILATTTGEWGLAERHFDHALGLNARTGARPLLARTQQDYARMLRSRARPEDELRARQLLDCASATYRDLRGKSAANASVRAGAQSHS